MPNHTNPLNSTHDIPHQEAEYLTDTPEIGESGEVLIIYHPAEEKWAVPVLTASLIGQQESKLIEASHPQLYQYIRQYYIIIIYTKYLDSWANTLISELWKQVGGASSESIFYLWLDDKPIKHRNFEVGNPFVKLRKINVANAKSILDEDIEAYYHKREIPMVNPFMGLRAYQEKEHYLFNSREADIQRVKEHLKTNSFIMVTGIKGSGKSSFIHAGVLPQIKCEVLQNAFSDTDPDSPNKESKDLQQKALPLEALPLEALQWEVISLAGEQCTIANLLLEINHLYNTHLKLGFDLKHQLDHYVHLPPTEQLSLLSILFQQITEAQKLSRTNINEEDLVFHPKGLPNNGLVIIAENLELINRPAKDNNHIFFRFLYHLSQYTRKKHAPIYIITSINADFLHELQTFEFSDHLLNDSLVFLTAFSAKQSAGNISKVMQITGQIVHPELLDKICLDFEANHYSLSAYQLAMREIWTQAYIDYDAEHAPKNLNQIAAQLGVLPLGYYPAKKKLNLDTSHWHKASTQYPNNQFASLLVPQNTGTDLEHGDSSPDLSINLSIANVIDCYAEGVLQKALAYKQADQTITEGLALKRLEAIKITFVTMLQNAFPEEISHQNNLQQSEAYAIDILLRIYKKADNTELGRMLLDLGHTLHQFRLNSVAFIMPLIADSPLALTLDPHTLLQCPHENILKHWKRLQIWLKDDLHDTQIFYDLQFQMGRWLENKKSTNHVLNSSQHQHFRKWYNQTHPPEIWLQSRLRPYVKSLIHQEQVNTPHFSDLDSSDTSEDSPNPYPVQSTVIQFLEHSQQKHRNQKIRNAAVVIVSVGAIIAAVYYYYMLGINVKEEEKKNADLIKAQADLATEQKKLKLSLSERIKSALLKNQLDSIQQEQILNEKLHIEEDLKKERINQETNAQLSKLKLKDAENERKNVENERLKLIEENKIARERQEESESFNRSLTAESIEKTKQRDNALKNQSLFIAGNANLLFKNNEIQLALLVALEALPKNKNPQNYERPYVKEAEAVLFTIANEMQNNIPKKTYMGHKNKITSMRFNSNDTRMITTSWDLTAKVWDVRTGSIIADLKHSNLVKGAEFSRGDRYILTYADEFNTKIWDGRTFNIRHTLAHKDIITYACFDADGKFVLTTSADRTAKVWTVEDGRLIATLKGHKGKINYGLFNKAQNSIATIGDDGKLMIWNINNGALKASFEHPQTINHCALSPDGNYIATACKDGTVRIFNLQNGNKTELYGHTQAVNYLSFAPNGSYLISGSSDKTARIWSMANKNLIKTLRGHASEVFYVDFTADQKYILSSGKDQYNILWDAESYLELARFVGQTSAQNHGIISRDVQSLMITQAKRRNQMGSSYVYDINLFTILPNRQELINYCNKFMVKNRRLTTEEREKWLKSASGG